MSRLPITPLYFFTFLLFSWLLTGCEGDSKAFISTIDAAKNKVVSIELTPTTEENVIIEVGQSQAFAVKATRKDGSTYTVDNKKLAWSFSCDEGDCGGFKINNNGVLSTLKNPTGGTATVTARYSSFSDSSTIKVSAAELESIEIRKQTEGQVINLCQSIELEAWGKYDDGSTRNITSAKETEWQIIGDNRNARLVKDQGRVFLSTSTKDNVNVQASRDALSGKLVTSDDPPLEVHGEFPNTISVTPETATIDLGGTLQYIAHGTWPDLSESKPITNNVSWTSDKVALSFSEKKAGLATGKTVADSIEISASCGAGEKIGTATAKVEKRVITSLQILRLDGTKPDSDGIYEISYNQTSPVTVTFAAYAVYDNIVDKNKDLSQQVSWNIDSGDEASIRIGQTPNASDPIEKRGNITGMKQGTPVLIKVLLRVDNVSNPDDWPAGYISVMVK